MTSSLSLPEDFDYVSLGELLDVIEQLCDFSRAGSGHEQPGEMEAWTRALRLLAHYRSAS